MRLTLDKEQTAHLVSLGFPIEKASTKFSIYNCETRQDILESRFNIHDLFVLLPKEYKSGFLYTEHDNNKVRVGYRLTNNYKIIEKSSTELVDAMYKLLKWVVRKKKYDNKVSTDNSKYFGNICYKNCE